MNLDMQNSNDREWDITSGYSLMEQLDLFHRAQALLMPGRTFNYELQRLFSEDAAPDHFYPLANRLHQEVLQVPLLKDVFLKHFYAVVEHDSSEYLSHFTPNRDEGSGDFILFVDEFIWATLGPELGFKLVKD